MALPKEWQTQDGLFAALFNDNGELQKNSLAQKYGGHQFGHWNPDLGDGRGLLLAEWITPNQQSWDLHLKGAGATPYSRGGDGRAVLRSTLREYLASEALYHLGIASSRALALISSSEIVYREKPEHAAMMIRTCPSHIRFGHFEYYYHSKQFNVLDKLFEYCLEQHFTDCLQQPNPKLALLQTICLSTAEMIAHWQAFGFNHGVMNSDNMSVHGITFDYGPYAFLDDFEPEYICNHSDHSGRYAFDQQPGIGLWNLNALAQAFTPYLSMGDIKTALSQYEPTLLNTYTALMHKRFGFIQANQQTQTLINRYLHLLAQDKRDYHLSFRQLCQLHPDSNNQDFANPFIDHDAAKTWLTDYLSIVFKHVDSQQWQSDMRAINPKYVLRNYLLQMAIDDAENGDFNLCEQLLNVTATPFDEHPDHEHLAKPPPDWGKHMEISCSS